jgi:hypothetical protein
MIRLLESYRKVFRMVPLYYRACLSTANYSRAIVDSQILVYRRICCSCIIAHLICHSHMRHQYGMVSKHTL